MRYQRPPHTFSMRMHRHSCNLASAIRLFALAITAIICGVGLSSDHASANDEILVSDIESHAVLMLHSNPAKDDKHTLHFWLDPRTQKGEVFKLSSPPRLVIDVPNWKNRLLVSETISDRRIARVRYSQHPTFLRIVVDLRAEISNLERKTASDIIVRFVNENGNQDEQEEPSKVEEPVVENPAFSNTATFDRSSKGTVTLSPLFSLLQPPIDPTTDLIVKTTTPGQRLAVTLRPLSEISRQKLEQIRVTPKSLTSGAQNQNGEWEHQVRFAYIRSEEVEYDLLYAIEIISDGETNNLDSPEGLEGSSAGFLSVRPLLERPAVEWSMSDGKIVVKNSGNISAWACVATSIENIEEECSFAGEGVLVAPGKSRLIPIPANKTGELRIIFGDRLERFPL